MSILKVVTGLSVTAALCLLVACGGSENSQPPIVPAPPQPTITMLLAYENLSCQPMRVNPALLIKELKDADVEVRAFSCPIQPDITFAQGCNLAQTNYFMVDVPQNQEQRLTNLGYREISVFPPPFIAPPLKADVCR